MSEVTLLDLSEAMCLLQGFNVGDEVQPAVMFVAGRAEGDAEEVLIEATQWLYRRFTSGHCLVFPGHDGSYADGERVPTGYAGFDAWSNRVADNLPTVGRDILASIFSCVVRTGHEKKTNTREETDGFVLRAKEQGWDRVWVLAYPHQLPRLMACLLKSIEEFSYPLTAIPRVPQDFSWMKPVFGSLGQVEKPRKEHIEEELLRIQLYQKEGWMASLTELTDWLMKMQESEYVSRAPLLWH